MEHSASWKAGSTLSYCRNSPPSVGSEGYLPCSQEHATGPYPELDVAHTLTSCLLRYSLICSCHLRLDLSSSPFLQAFRLKCCMRTSHAICMSHPSHRHQTDRFERRLTQLVAQGDFITFHSNLTSRFVKESLKSLPRQHLASDDAIRGKSAHIAYFVHVPRYFFELLISSSYQHSC